MTEAHVVDPLSEVHFFSTCGDLLPHETLFTLCGQLERVFDTDTSYLLWCPQAMRVGFESLCSDCSPRCLEESCMIVLGQSCLMYADEEVKRCKGAIVS
jgi:hypothetical protein